MANYDIQNLSCEEQWWEESKFVPLDRSIAAPRRTGCCYTPEEIETDNQYWDERAQFLRRLWDDHLTDLSSEEKLLISSGNHPCENIEDEAAAARFVEPFIGEMTGLPFVETARMDLYHGGTYVVTVELKKNMHWTEYRPAIPTFWRGVAVKIWWPEIPDSDGRGEG